MKPVPRPPMLLPVGDTCCEFLYLLLIEIEGFTLFRGYITLYRFESDFVFAIMRIVYVCCSAAKKGENHEKEEKLL